MARRRRRRRDRKDESDAWPSVYLTHLFHAALRTAGYVALSIGLDPLAPACHDPLFVKPPFNHPRVPRPQPLARAGVRLTSTSPPHPIGFGPRRSSQQPFRSPLGERRSRDSANPALRYRWGDKGTKWGSWVFGMILFSGVLEFFYLEFNRGLCSKIEKDWNFFLFFGRFLDYSLTFIGSRFGEGKDFVMRVWNP